MTKVKVSHQRAYMFCAFVAMMALVFEVEARKREVEAPESHEYPGGWVLALGPERPLFCGHETGESKRDPFSEEEKDAE